MIENPHILEIEATQTAIIPLVIPRSEMRAMIGPAIQELIRAAKAQGLEKTGPWFAHHLSLSVEQFNFEVSIPVSGKFTATGRAIPGIWPSGTVARAILRGDYSNLVAAWDELRQWIDAAGRTRATHIYEVYTVTPATTADPADWITELNWPLLA